MQQLSDGFGRLFSYLRLSITDACNFSCAYCLPNGYCRPENQAEFLNLVEIENLVTAFTELGMWKVRITGGEPTLRRDLIQIVKTIHAIPGVRKIALSTNGYRLKSIAKDLFSAGVQNINISVDSLNPQRFREITGSDSLAEVLEGIEKSLEMGFQQIKINAVLLKGWNEHEFKLFKEWIRNKKITVRFIELMPTGQTTPFFSERHQKTDSLRASLIREGWKEQAREEADGPALEYFHPDSVGKIGLIAPYSSHFCATCNRLRVTSQGALKLCLFGNENHSLRHLLQTGSQKQELKDQLILLLRKKEISHYLPEGLYGNNQTFSAMGG